MDRTSFSAVYKDFQSIKDRQEQKDRATKRTRDAFDAMLTCPTDAEWAAYRASFQARDPGIIWDGLIMPIFDRVDEATATKLFASMDAYRARRKARDATRDRDFDPLGRRETAKEVRKINDANDAMWNQSPRP